MSSVPISVDTDIEWGFDLDFTRVRRPLFSGQIKSVPSDFVVDEILGFKPTGEGEHVFLQVRKKGLNTGWVAEQIAAFCGIRHFDVGFAGRKDRHAVTTQWFSCYLPGKEVDWSLVQIEGLEILDITRHTRKLRKGDLDGNRFKIVVRDIVPAIADEVEEEVEVKSTERISLENSIRTVINDIRINGFPNYYGEQRFGFCGNNLIKAIEYFQTTIRSKGESERVKESGKNRRRDKRGRKTDIYISAARSCLFNTWLAQKVETHCWQTVDNNEGPLYGDDVDQNLFTSGSLRQLCEGLNSLRIKEAVRQVVVHPDNLTWDLAPLDVTDSGVEINSAQVDLVLEFDLPKGVYATSLLREILRYEVT